MHWLVTSPEDMAVLAEINRGASDRALGRSRLKSTTQLDTTSTTNRRKRSSGASPTGTPRT
jgi:hypothetical protein